MEKATFAGGCFWCTEAIFKRLRGVKTVESGYSGGEMDNPNYSAVSEGNTGHAEAVQVTFEPKIISFDKLLEVFWATHDPTTLNMQGNDIGTQYRSAIFYHNTQQQRLAEESRKTHQEKLKDNIVTEIKPFEKFYKAEEYHQNYYDNNQNYPYCSFIIAPKIKKLLEKFGTDIKEEYKN
ncbi:MAG: peptide-methionine (S)-S-oxide reductase [Candidatus Levybacteria bacterium RIFCSPHIGHO2_01_FULL_37_17]|nr:MAG: peptide-methionine (S)-S-oxide reductase [Candidatus Levybacteria bacterium RIFCSPHIGHO2_01_FULL_37_17]OGH36985.1 MAG: peptide-methionine (S)-S-oxide reductase [Candidatus Levybacteria bacterium RIFCSPLOWO2_01_FULL_38_23]